MTSRLALLGFLTVAHVMSAATTIVRGPYLQSATPTSMVVRWRTDTTEASVVTYGTEKSKMTATAKAEGVSAEHIVQLSNLKPGTTYYYAVGATPLAPPAPNAKEVEDGPGRPGISSFTTPPEVGTIKPTRIWVLGDPGTKNQQQANVRDAYTKFTGQRPTDLWLLLGDNAYPEGTDADYQKAIFEMYPTFLRSSPVWQIGRAHV